MAAPNALERRLDQLERLVSPGRTDARAAAAELAAQREAARGAFDAVASDRATFAREYVATVRKLRAALGELLVSARRLAPIEDADQAAYGEQKPALQLGAVGELHPPLPGSRGLVEHIDFAVREADALAAAVEKGRR